MSWITDIFSPKERSWEDFYRNRWAYDKIVRSTHGVNCTGSCSWNIYVKQGLVTWEMQALDYPQIDPELPPYEPRGCQRGISYSWYIYSPLRVKYPMVRGALWDLWEEAQKEFPNNPLQAWQSIVSDPQKRKRYQTARGKGGFRRVRWHQVHEMMAAANLHTVEKYGPDRLIGFSPIPAMSMISYAGGSRFLQLMGGANLSFYDWYCDLPPASPEIWGEQTDVAESADWFRSKFIAVVGSNVLMTRTPDSHFLVEARHRGAKVVTFSPDFSQTSKAADEWVPIHQGQDGAFWMAVNHVILKENYIDRQVDSFISYQKKYTDAPFLVTLESAGDKGYKPGALLRAAELVDYKDSENGEWKFCVCDTEGQIRVPRGTVGHRWQKKKGEWNLDFNDEHGNEYEPEVRIGDRQQQRLEISVSDFSQGDEVVLRRSVPAFQVETVAGQVWVTTGLELTLAQHGVAEPDAELGSSEQWPSNYQDGSALFTPAWQEQFTGIGAEVVIRFARDWSKTAELSGGKCSIIIGAGVNHWYHNNLIYRAAINALILCGCVGKSGGGCNHYVGQEKLVPQASWAPIAMGGDWGGPPRLQNAPSFHYMHTDQWRYDREFNEVCPVSEKGHPFAHGHTADKQALAVRNGYLPCYPQFNKSNFDVIEDAYKAGAKDDDGIKKHVVDSLKKRKLKFSMEDPNKPESYPRVWYIWRGNALASSAKGHEYFLKHYLGTHHNAISQEAAKDSIKDVTWHDKVELGKIDLVVDLNFRMDTSALYSDIVLPASTYYEKDDLSSTDMHSFIHPLQAAVPPCWESKSDWQIFKECAKYTSRMAEKHMPEVRKDVVLTPLMHDTPAEMSQSKVLDWAKGECEPIPGKTMPNIKVVDRDYTKIYQKFISLGPNFRNNGLGVHGTSYAVDDLYDEYLEHAPTVEWEGKTYPSLAVDKDVCEAILHFAAETNGECAHRAYESESKKTGIDHTHLAKDTRAVRITWDAICTEPRRILSTPFWSGITNGRRTYSAYCQNIEERIPWRTLTGRQHMYLDHEAYRSFGEHLPTYKPRPEQTALHDLDHTEQDSGSIVLNYLTPHGKWHIHSTYSDNLRMKTLSRGIEPVWMNERDAGLAGLRDNDWVEIVNDHGAVVTRVCVSARIPRGLCFIYHATERTVGVPKSQVRGNRRAGNHNSLTRARLKPLFMIGGYAQFTYAFNYWGPQGINRDTFVVIKKLEKLVW